MAVSSGPSTRPIVRVFFTVVGLVAGLYLLYRVRSVVGLLAIAAFLSVALGPSVGFFHRRGLSRGLSIVVVYVTLALAVVGIGLLLVPPIVSQVNKFAHHLPAYIQDAKKNRTVRKYDRRYHIFKRLEEQAKKLLSRLAKAAGAL